MKQNLLIYGAGGLGREILSWIKHLGDWEPIGFIDDQVSPGTRIHGLEVKGNGNILKTANEPVNVVLAFGDPLTKAKTFQRIVSSFVRYPVFIHPGALLQDPHSIHIGAGSVICPGCILTVDITVGEHVLLNLKTTVGHDVTIGDFSSLMPSTNIAGEVRIESGVLIGSGVSVRNRMTIGSGSTVGMGSVVVNNIAPGSVVYGVPAKSVEK